MMLRSRKPLALAWIGHRASDEMGAMLAVMQADGPDSFRAALAQFAVPGLNMLHAGRDGRIGHVLAAWLPRRPPTMPADLVLGREGGAAWEETVGAAELPHRRDPAEGFLVSANDQPPKTEVLIGLFFSAADRARRMRRRLGGTAQLGLEELAALQQDVAAEGAPVVRDLLLARIGARQRRAAAVRALAAWDGGYAAESRRGARVRGAARSACRAAREARAAQGGRRGVDGAGIARGGDRADAGGGASAAHGGCRCGSGTGAAAVSALGCGAPDAAGPPARAGAAARAALRLRGMGGGWWQGDAQQDRASAGARAA